MKINVITQKKEFQPIKLELTIETQDEFDTLWHRMNIGIGMLQSYIRERNITNNQIDSGSRDIWEKLQALR